MTTEPIQPDSTSLERLRAGERHRAGESARNAPTGVLYRWAADKTTPMPWRKAANAELKRRGENYVS